MQCSINCLNKTIFSTDVDTLELLNGKRFDFIRTPTQSELNKYTAGDGLSNYEMNTRTMDEQDALIESDGDFLLGFGHGRSNDDWFTLLNLSYRFTALGNWILTGQQK